MERWRHLDVADQASEKPSGDDDHVKVKGKISLKEISFDMMGKPRNLGIVLLYVGLLILVAGAVFWAIGNGRPENGPIDNGTERSWRDQPLSDLLEQ